RWLRAAGGVRLRLRAHAAPRRERERRGVTALSRAAEHALRSGSGRRTMLHTIGRKSRSERLTEMLADCHARIRSFIALAIAAGEQQAPPEEVAAACARVERYFVQAFPLHVRDEEDSVLPRLRGR